MASDELMAFLLALSHLDLSPAERAGRVALVARPYGRSSSTVSAPTRTRDRERRVWSAGRDEAGC